MNRGAKIVIVAVVALFALTGIYYAFSSPKARTTASRDTDAGRADSAAGRISDPVAPGASVPQVLTMGPAATTAPSGAGLTPPDSAFGRPASGQGMPGQGTGMVAPGGTATAGPGSTATALGAPASSPGATAPSSLAPIIAPPTTPATSPTTGVAPRMLSPERTAATTQGSNAPTTAPSINPPAGGTVSPVSPKPSTVSAAAPGTASYTIKAGDTFSTIAGDLYKDTRKWTVIAKANPGVDPSRLKVGQVIKVPTDGAIARQATTVPERASASSGPAGATHTVASGETLSAIAERYLGSKGAWKRLYEANKDAIGGDPAKLKVGMKLVIPAR